MRSSPAFAAAVVLVLVFLGSGSGAAARPVVSHGGSDVAIDRAVAVEFTGTDSSAEPSNCTYGNNIGGECPPSVGH
ncbi:hypothetical protein EJB05_04015, partial [Eragrostis curvula]